MPQQGRRTRHRYVVAALLATLMVTALTSCSTSRQAARTMAERYVALIASGNGAALAELWEITATGDRDLRTAGDLLSGATERIEVLAIGGVTDHLGDPADLPALPASLDSQGLVEVPVRYRLAGVEHDDTVVLAPRRDRPGSDPDNWRVVRPLVGSLTLYRASGTSFQPDLYVSGRPLSGSEARAYPGVYGVQLRADPYLTSTTGSVTVTPGRSVSVPDLDVTGTPAAREALQKQVLAMFARCEDGPGKCPPTVSDLVRDSHPEAAESDGWRLTLVERPDTWTIGPHEVSYGGGRFDLSFPDGTTRTVLFHATSPWRFGSDPPSPMLVAAETRIEVAS